MPTIYKHEIVRGWLQNASIAYKNASYVAGSVYPQLDMKSPKAKLWKANKGDSFRSESVLRAPMSDSAIRVRKGTYVNVNTNEYGIKEAITERDMQMVGLNLETTPSLNLQQDAIEACADQHLLRQEIAVAADVIAQAWAGQSAGGIDAAGLWVPPGSTNTLIADIVMGKGTLSALGIDISRLALVVDGKTWLGMKECDDVRDRIKYTSAESISPAMVAQMLGLLEVNVAYALKNTANEKQDGTDATFVQIWEVNATKGMAFLYYKPPAIAKNMVIPGVQPIVPIGGQLRTNEMYLDMPKHCWWVEAREDIGVDEVCTDAGIMWKDTALT